MRILRCLVVSVAATLTALVMTSAANAATGYTPSGGPNMNFVGSSLSFTVAASPVPQTITCPTFNLAGSIDTSGATRPFGQDAGTISSLTSGGCINPIASPTVIVPLGTWGLAITGAETGSVSRAEINNVEARVTVAGCTFDVAGTVNGTFNESTQKLTPGGSTLSITSTTGAICPFFGWSPGQLVSVAGSWTNTPPSGSTAVTITNP